MDATKDACFLNPETGHHTVVRYGAEGLKVIYFGAGPTISKSGKLYYRRSSGSFYVSIPSEELIFRSGRVQFLENTSEHVDEAIDRLKLTIAYVEFCKFLTTKHPFVTNTYLYELSSRKDTRYLALQAARGEDLEIRLETVLDRYGKLMTRTRIQIGEIYIPAGTPASEHSPDKPTVQNYVRIGAISVR